jgi:hypothetical protein
VNFRSRLEARWAAFFDLREWAWSYEPIDFNGWIPDFLVRPRLGIRRAENGDLIYGGTVDLYAEVKPVRVQGPRLQEDFGKALAHCRDVWVLLLLGAEPHFPPGGSRPSLGWLLDAPTDNISDRFGHISAVLDGMSPADPKEWCDLEALWREAGNRVQWRAPA